MRRVLEKEVNALGPVIRKGQDLIGTVFVDATAGDAADENASPQLILQYRQVLRAQRLLAPTYLFERNAKTCATLRENLSPLTWAEQGSVAQQVHILNEDATTGVLNVSHRRHTLLYIDDPNHSGGSTITDEVAAWAFENPMATLFLSIGANANGVARLPGHYERCLAQYEHLLEVAERVRLYRRGVIFTRVTNDSHRWAYAVVGSERFIDSYRPSLEAIGSVTIGFDAVRRQLDALFTAKKKEQPQLPFARGRSIEPTPNISGIPSSSPSAESSLSAPAGAVSGAA